MLWLVLYLQLKIIRRCVVTRFKIGCNSIKYKYMYIFSEVLYLPPWLTAQVWVIFPFIWLMVITIYDITLHILDIVLSIFCWRCMRNVRRVGAARHLPLYDFLLRPAENLGPGRRPEGTDGEGLLPA